MKLEGVGLALVTSWRRSTDQFGDKISLHPALPIHWPLSFEVRRSLLCICY